MKRIYFFKGELYTIRIVAFLAAFIAIASFSEKAIPPRPEGPGDIFNAAGFPCITAHSTTRALFADYNGPLYQVMRQSDGKTLDIGIVQPVEGDPGGYANAAKHDEFCKNTLAWITVIYDQSGNDNHLYQAPPGTFVGPDKGGFNTLPIADMAPITIMGHKVYGTYVIPGMGLRNNDAKGLGINDEPEGIYMVMNGKHFDSGCCFNYGNTSANSRAVGTGTMSTVYFGTSTAWGKGAGSGPWIMSDMEAGLFSGYKTKENPENPTIDSWTFVTGMVNGGGGNQWEIRGGNAQEGDLQLFYKGIRPQSMENQNYFPMHKKGSVQMGNGGDNGNGSAGTFYEGIMTKGYPSEEAVNAVQKNIVNAKYNVPAITLSRLTTFTPQSSQEVTLTYTNTTGAPVTNVSLSLDLPSGWTASVAGSNDKSKTFTQTIAPGQSVESVFKISSPLTASAAYFTGNADLGNASTGQKRFVTSSQRIRNVSPVKINEVRFTTGTNRTNQFIELYNSSEKEVDISNWTIINTKSEWAPVQLASIPPGTRLAPKAFYLLAMASTGTASPVTKNTNTIHVLNASGFEAGQQINIGGESRKIKSVGTPASEMTMVFVPVSTGPWMNIPVGSTNIPVINANGFKEGDKIGIDIGGQYEEAIVTNVGKASTLTNLAEEAKAGETIIKVLANSNMTVGDKLTIGTGTRKEVAEIKRLINVVEAPTRSGFGQSENNKSPGQVELTSPLKFDHMLDVDVSDRGTGISFSPATKYMHKSGEAIQALGSGIELELPLEKNHAYGAPVLYPNIKTSGYQGPAPDQWFGTPLSTLAGSIALMNADGKLVVDAVVYGSQQSNSSANGTIASPELATLEGDQSQGGCIVVVPENRRSSRFATANPVETNKSYGRFPDGSDTDSNCKDFLQQSTNRLLRASSAGEQNIKVGSVSNFVAGQRIFIGAGSNEEAVEISAVGTGGGTTSGARAMSGTAVIPVFSVEGFLKGQSITIDSGQKLETAIVASVVAGRRFGAGEVPTDTIRLSAPLVLTHESGVQVSGSGITFSKPLSKKHESGEQIANAVPTPGEPNKF